MILIKKLIKPFSIQRILSHQTLSHIKSHIEGRQNIPNSVSALTNFIPVQQKSIFQTIIHKINNKSQNKRKIICNYIKSILDCINNGKLLDYEKFEFVQESLLFTINKSIIESRKKNMVYRRNDVKDIGKLNLINQKQVEGVLIHRDCNLPIQCYKIQNTQRIIKFKQNKIQNKQIVLKQIQIKKEIYQKKKYADFYYTQWSLIPDVRILVCFYQYQTTAPLVLSTSQQTTSLYKILLQAQTYNMGLGPSKTLITDIGLIMRGNYWVT